MANTQITIEQLMSHYSPKGFWGHLFKNLSPVTKGDCIEAYQAFCNAENYEYDDTIYLDDTNREYVRDILFVMKGREVTNTEHAPFVKSLFLKERLDKEFLLKWSKTILLAYSSASNKENDKWFTKHSKTKDFKNRMKYIQWYWNWKQTFIEKQKTI